MPRAAPPPELAARRGGAGRIRVRGNREPLHFHSHDGVGVALVLGALAQLSLLPSEEPRQVRPVLPFEVARPEIVGLHHVKVAVQDEIAVTSHIAPPQGADYLQKGRRDKGLDDRSPIGSL